MGQRMKLTTSDRLALEPFVAECCEAATELDKMPVDLFRAAQRLAAAQTQWADEYVRLLGGTQHHAEQACQRMMKRRWKR